MISKVCFLFLRRGGPIRCTVTNSSDLLLLTANSKKQGKVLKGRVGSYRLAYICVTNFSFIYQVHRCTHVRISASGMFSWLVYSNVHGLQQVGGIERKKAHIDVVSLKELTDGCGNLPLKIGHDYKSSLTWILQRFSLGLDIRNNDLIDILDHCLLCGPVFWGMCHMPISREFKTRVAVCSLALVD